jgi:hypothetical protein
MRTAIKLLTLGLFVSAAMAFAGIIVGQTAGERERVLYQQDLRPTIAWIHHDEILFGRLDQYGNFVEGKWARRNEPDKIKIMLLFAPPQFFKFLNTPYEPNEKVLEYRSGRLVEGVIDENYRFVPTAGKKVLAFEDYCPGRNAVRIYNLPGYFGEKHQGWDHSIGDLIPE